MWIGIWMRNLGRRALKMESDSMNFFGQSNRKKLYAIVVGLVMILSGILATTVVVGAGDRGRPGGPEKQQPRPTRGNRSKRN